MALATEAEGLMPRSHQRVRSRLSKRPKQAERPSRELPPYAGPGRSCRGGRKQLCTDPISGRRLRRAPPAFVVRPGAQLIFVHAALAPRPAQNHVSRARVIASDRLEVGSRTTADEVERRRIEPRQPWFRRFPCQQAGEAPLPDAPCRIGWQCPILRNWQLIRKTRIGVRPCPESKVSVLS